MSNVNDERLYPLMDSFTFGIGGGSSLSHIPDAFIVEVDERVRKVSPHPLHDWTAWLGSLPDQEAQWARQVCQEMAEYEYRKIVHDTPIQYNRYVGVCDVMGWSYR